MAYSKSFPKQSDKSIYPKWEDVTLSFEEEEKIEEKTRTENKRIMSMSLIDAKEILESTKLPTSIDAVTKIATTLFEKLASHVVFHKEAYAKEKSRKKNDTK